MAVLPLGRFDPANIIAEAAARAAVQTIIASGSPGSERDGRLPITIGTGVPRRQGGQGDESLVFRNRPLSSIARHAARVAGASVRLRPGARRPGVSGHGRTRPLCREARLRLDQPVRAPLFAAYPDPVATAVGRLPGEPGGY